MTEQAYVFELTEQSFGTSAVLNSHKIPVLVEFMGVWSGPCVVMADRLTALATEFAGQFIFAKVDIEEQPGLKEQYKIENVPTLLLFKDGEVIRTEMGELQDAELRALLKDYGIFRESDEMRGQAREKHMAGNTQAAIMLLTEAIKKDPANIRIALDMVQIFIDLGDLDQARGLFARLPEGVRESEIGKALSGQVRMLDLASKTAGIEVLKGQIAQDNGNHDARFDLAICLVAQHDYQQAMDNLLIIMEQSPDYKEGAARELIATLVNTLTPNAPELAVEYRRKLANMVAG